MKKRWMPLWVILFSLTVIVLMSTRVRSADTLQDGTTTQVFTDDTVQDGVDKAKDVVDDGKRAVGNAAGQAQQAMPMQGQGGGEKGGCCG